MLAALKKQNKTNTTRCKLIEKSFSINGGTQRVGVAFESLGEPWGHSRGTLPWKSLKRRDRPLGPCPSAGNGEQSRRGAGPA